MDIYPSVDWSVAATREFAVRVMTAEDLPALEIMVAEIDHGVWTAREFSTSLAFNHACWVLIDTQAPQVPIGYLVMSVVHDEAELLMLGVASHYQRRGLGRELLSHAIADLPKSVESVFLEVRASNEKAQQLYRFLGFYEVGLRRRYYRARNGYPAEDAVLMRLSLESL